jgi:outer membrane lipoprotein-sorting protein
MKKKNYLIILLLCLFSFTNAQKVSKIQPTEILKKAELQRVPWKSMSLSAFILNNNIEYEYRVFYDDRKTLIAYMKPDLERGNLLLMKNEDLWFYVKRTKRPIRITPIQRLSGATSFGDLARLDWSVDYSIEKMTEGKDTINGRKTDIYMFDLKAKTKSATYQRIKLTIDKINYRPLYSEVYLISGKLYKTLIFTKYEKIKGSVINTQIKFIDNFSKGKESIIDFKNVKKEKKIPSRYYLKTSLQDIFEEIE